MNPRPRHSLIVFAGLALGIFIAALDQTVVVTALPSMITDLQIPFTKLNQAAWIVTGYLLGYTVAMPLFGRVSDVYGRRRTYILCTITFIVGSVLCGLSRDLYWLLGARILQAAGGGAIVPVVMAIAGDEITPGRRALVLGAIGAIAEAGGVLGPLYGATIVEHLSWQWIFFLNVPLGGIAIFSAFLTSSADHPSSGKVDFLGAAILGASLAALTIGLSLDVTPDTSLLPAVILVAGALALLVLFFAVESRAEHPLLDLALFRRRDLAASNVANLLIGIALISAMVDVPLFAATVLQRSPLAGGLMLMRLTAAIPVGALLGGWLCHRFGPRLTAILGLGLSALGLYLTSQWTSQVGDWAITRDLLIAGLGFGLVIAPITTSALSAVSANRAGVASALVTVMRMIGMMIGLSALTAWGLGRFNSLVAAVPMPLPMVDEAQDVFQQRLHAYQQTILNATLSIFNEVFVAAAVVCVVAIVIALFLRGREGELASASGETPVALS